ncbi:hypothetical protein RFI_28749 [Reticulomyxa filosa]|uniref:Uncharacterized protein n=1 Tax=Reticulomyxa filosa TaxID=46433 RepID=X6M3T3_RETFI|nr:hypothetical protein RFI_28749 [Reticulomyxa filosa]|eukprot:ETO08638.1 hypothetical protein RFI_28749 [Reticulomyxa filosa]
MGGEQSTQSTQDTHALRWVYKINNDYELAIRLSKELEGVLTEYFQAEGKGLHEKITSGIEKYNSRNRGSPFPRQLERNMRRLATIRNKLIHERGFDAIPDKEGFITTFDESYQELQKLCGNIRIGHNHNSPKKEDFRKKMFQVKLQYSFFDGFFTVSWM